MEKRLQVLGSPAGGIHWTVPLQKGTLRPKVAVSGSACRVGRKDVFPFSISPRLVPQRPSPFLHFPLTSRFSFSFLSFLWGTQGRVVQRQKVRPDGSDPLTFFYFQPHFWKTWWACSVFRYSTNCWAVFLLSVVLAMAIGVPRYSFSASGNWIRSVSSVSR